MLKELTSEKPSLYKEKFLKLIPELQDEVGLDQRNPWHHLDVWEHTLLAMDLSPADKIIRMALLLHDIGKPSCMFVDEDGIGHFYGHPRKGAEMAEKILERFSEFSFEEKALIIELIKEHDSYIGSKPKSIRKRILKWGEDLPKLIEVQKADAFAHNPEKQEARTSHLVGLEERIQEVKETM